MISIVDRACLAQSPLRRGIQRWLIVAVLVVLAVATHADAQAGSAKPAPEHKGAAITHAHPKPLLPGAVTSDWPWFGGPAHDFHSPETGLLKTFPPAGPKLVWSMETGSGYASPSIKGDKLIYFHRVGDENRVECLHRETGAAIWSFSYTSHYKDRYDFSDGPRATPVIDAGRVYTYGPEGKLHCLDLETGKPLWQRDLFTDFKAEKNFFGVGTSPLIDGDFVIVNVGGKGGPAVVALDKSNGKTVWRAGDKWGDSYATPLPTLVDGARRVLVMAGGLADPAIGGLLSIDPKTGAIDARFPFPRSRYESVYAASPVVFDSKVLLSTSYGTGSVLVDLASGGSAKKVWHTNALRAHYATPIYKDGFVYGFDGGSRSDSGMVCVDARTGAEKWRASPTWEDELTVNGAAKTVSVGLMSGALIHVDGRFLCLSQMGSLLWLDLTPKGYHQTSRARLFFAGETWTPPVVSRGLLYVCQNVRDTMAGTPPRLLCYDLRGR